MLGQALGKLAKLIAVSGQFHQDMIVYIFRLLRKYILYILPEILLKYCISEILLVCRMSDYID